MKRRGHSMWSYIVDERGFRRIAIFYKAAFYDRRAHFSIMKVPRTKAQEDTYFQLCQSTYGRRSASGPYWRAREHRRKGDSVIFAWDRIGEGGKPDGEYVEATVAMDGTIVQQRGMATD